MNVFETAKFKKQREMLSGGEEKDAFKKAVLDVVGNPETEKKFQGELAGLRHFRYLASGQPKRLIYKLTADSLVFLSFGPWMIHPKS